MVDYCTTKQIHQFLGTFERVPFAINGDAENVGTGDDSATIFYLDNRNVIAGTYTLYHMSGSWDINSATALTETTHYTLDKDEGTITLTGAGVTEVSTDDIFAVYWYSNAYSDTAISDAIQRAEDLLDHKTHHAWRTTSVSEEYHNFPLDENRSGYFTGAGLEINLFHREIKLTDGALDTSEGDKLEVFDGDNWIDWTDTYTEGRGEDYWIEPKIGVLWVRSFSIFAGASSVRLTYRYGASSVPKDIEEATIKLTAIDLITTDDRAVTVAEHAGQFSFFNKVEFWKKKVEEIISNRAEFVFTK